MSNKVRIVGSELGGERILARLAKLLAAGTGWTTGEAPDARAEANIFLPYLLVPKAGWSRTPTVAWFTHREIEVPAKVKAFDRAAGQVTLRTTSAPMWQRALEGFGPTALITPPLDRAIFTPAGAKNSRRTALPRIGTSGYTYGGGRKGETVWKSLTGSPLKDHAEWTACGRGWGLHITKHLRRYEDLAPWYRSLDLYVCASLTEGIPYGPLEALACGIPVVIPRGVGLLDSLPYQDGIYRYDAGDAEGLHGAVKLALTHRAEKHVPDPEALRAVTERFTAAAWCADWESAVHLLLHGAPAEAPASLDRQESAPEPPDAPNHHPAQHDAPVVVPARLQRGIVCVAYGDPARKCAKNLMATVKKHAPEIPVCLIADRPIGPETFWKEYPDEDLGARSAKTNLYHSAPAEWDSVLYLDADTWLLAHPGPIFHVLENGWDLALTTDPSKYSLAKYGLRPDNKDEAAETFKLWGTDEFLQINGGVCGFRRSPEVEAFWQAWHDEWLVYAKRDQMALDRALLRHPLRVWLMGRPFNQIVRYGSPGPSTVIAHAPITARRWTGIVPGRLDSLQARRLAEVGLNRHPEPPAGLRTGRR